MSQTEPSTVDAGTGSADYAAAYFHDHLGPPYTYEEPHWKRFFGGIADALVELFHPGTTYDAGCAKGFLVRSLAERGVDARGGDISEFAIAGAPPELAPRLEVKDLTEPFSDRYDLITCIEVLEHMSPDDARTAVANLCAATDVIVLSTTPDDFAESTHINIRQPWEWAQDFAMHGFFRRTDVDASFVSPWAVILQRDTPGTVELVNRYEAMLAPLIREVDTKRRTLLETQRQLDQNSAPVFADRDALAAERDAVAAERDALAGEIAAFGVADLAQERMNRLALADELIGVRAELAQTRVHSEMAVAAARQEADRLRASLDSMLADVAASKHNVGTARQERDSELRAVRASFTWRIGSIAMLPVRVLRKLRRR